MPFYSLLNPVNDESFTSWITRCELRLSPRRFSSKKIQASYSENLHRAPTLDPDFSIEILASTTIGDTILVNPQMVLSIFLPRSTWTLPYAYSNSVCIDCLMESLKKHRCFVFLKSWRYVAHPICPFHRCLLSDIPYMQGKGLRTLPDKLDSTNKCNVDSQQMKRLVLLALKIQRHICRLEDNPTNDEIKIKGAFRFLMELFMADGECRGLACFLFSKPTPERGALKHSGARVLMLLGAFNSSSFERMCSLILTGYVIGFLSERECHIFEDILKERSLLHQCSTFEIGQRSNVFLEKELPPIKRRLEALRSVFTCQRFIEFVKGFESA